MTLSTPSVVSISNISVRSIRKPAGRRRRAIRASRGRAGLADYRFPAQEAIPRPVFRRAFWKTLGRDGRSIRKGRVVGDFAELQEMPVEAAPCREQSALAGGFRAAAEFGQIRLQIGRCGGGDPGPAPFEPEGKQRQVAAIARQRIGGQAMFEPHRVDETIEGGATGLRQRRLGHVHGSSGSGAASWASSQRLVSSRNPPVEFAKPPRPLAETTLWQGTTSG